MSNPKNDNFTLLCSCGKEICRSNQTSIRPGKRRGQLDLFLNRVGSVGSLVTIPRNSGSIYQCQCGKTVASSTRTGIKVDPFATNVSISNRTMKTIDFLRNRQRQGPPRSSFGKTRRNVSGQSSHQVFRIHGNNFGRGRRNRSGRRNNDYERYDRRPRDNYNRYPNNRRGNRPQRSHHSRTVYFRDSFMIKNDLRNLLRQLKRQNNESVDSLEVIRRKDSKFVTNVLNSDTIQGMGSEEVMLILQILNISFSKTISDPTLFIRNVLLKTRFVTDGFSIFIRSKYFESLYNIELLSKLFKLIMKYCPEDSLKKLPLDCYEKIILPINAEDKLVREIIERKTKLEERSKPRNAEEEEEEEEELEEEEEEERDWGYEYASIIPERKDFVFGNEKARKLPPKNVFDWKGISQKQYLSTHFKLIREDYIGKFKEGFRKWTDFSSGRVEDFDFRDMNVFTKVRFKNYRISKYGEYELVCRFSLPSETMKRKLKKRTYSTYISSKALMRNSLVVLFRESNDQLNEDAESGLDPIVCLVVANERIRQHEVSLKPYNVHQFRKIKLESCYLMIESPVFFTAYECVLKSLQEKETVPFREVILDGNNEKNLPPKYIQRNPRLKFSKIKKKREVEEPQIGERQQDCSSFIENCVTSWPKTESTILNDSENVGMRDVFRKKVTLIQGGPGTGKTFIGRKIAQVMNENRGVHPQPIVIICYTNHALDAFLEPLLNDFPRMVRIGTRTRVQNPRYLKRQMKNLMSPRARGFSSIFGGRGFDLQQKLRKNSSQIRTLGRRLRELNRYRFEFRDWRSIIEKNMVFFQPLFDLIVKGFKDEFDPIEKKYFSDHNITNRVILLDFWLGGKEKRAEVSLLRESIRKKLKRNTVRRMKKKQKERERKLRERERRERRRREEEERLRREEERRLEELRRQEEAERRRLEELDRRNRILEERRRLEREEREKRRKKEEEKKKISSVQKVVKKKKKKVVVRKLVKKIVKKKVKKIVKKKRKRMKKTKEKDGEKEEEEEEWRKKKREARRKFIQAKEKNKKKRNSNMKKKGSSNFNSKKKNRRVAVDEEEEDDDDETNSVLNWGEDDDMEMDPSILEKKRIEMDSYLRDLEDIVAGKRTQENNEDSSKIEEEEDDVGLISNEEEEEEEEDGGEVEEEENETMEVSSSSNEEEEEVEFVEEEVETETETEEEMEELVEIFVEEEIEVPEEVEEEDVITPIPNQEQEDNKEVQEAEKEESETNQKVEAQETPRETLKDDKKSEKKPEEISSSQVPAPTEALQQLSEEEEEEEEEDWELQDLKYIESKQNPNEELIDPLLLIQEKENERRKEEEERAEVMNFLRVFSEEDEELFALMEQEEEAAAQNGERGNRLLFFEDATIPNYFQNLKNNVSQKLNDSMPNNPWVLKDRRSRVDALKALHKFFQICLRVEEMKSFSKFRELFDTRRKIKLEMELQILKSADIVGLTSTMASIRRRLLKKLNAKIYIFEEAAELLEGQIIACIPKDVEHLILIGDHHQLKPKINMIQLRSCNIDVSLFERMAKIGVNPRSLLIQQRMRPEISYFMRHFFYPRMVDHESVSKYPNVVGHCMNVQFISHSMPESTSRGSRSKFNNYEAKLVVNHALFILKHRRYRPNQITIITPYKGQLFVIKDLLRKSNVRGGLRVETVDDYQGEENEIILVSLVRSRTRFESSRESIGFLRIQNRIIVLMSRAKHGIYIYGNSALLERRSGDWEKILNVLEEHDQLKDYLFIKCENHPENTAKIAHPDEFNKFTCDLTCNYKWPGCHHKCQKKCHQFTKHPKCRSICDRVMSKCGHRCKRKCHAEHDRLEMKERQETNEEEEEEEEDGEKKEIEIESKCVCNETIIHQFSDCPHEISVRCGTNLENLKCRKVVEMRFPKCGHVREIYCFEKNEILCEENVLITLPCGHFHPKKCHEVLNPDQLQFLSLMCTEIVEYVPECGHKRTRNCNVKVEDMGEQELRCMKMVQRRLDCGHLKHMRCFQQLEDLPVEKQRCKSLCRKRLEICGHRCPGRCFECKENGSHRKCQQIVNDECIKCGGKMQRKCEESGFCSNKCNVVLNCKHRCSNRCGSCQGNHSCSNMCKREMICGHKCSGNHGCGLNRCSKCSNLNIFLCSHGYNCGQRIDNYCCSGDYRFCGKTQFCEHHVPMNEKCEVCENQSEYQYYKRGRSFVRFDRDLHGKKRYGSYWPKCRNRCRHRRCSKMCYQVCDIRPCLRRCEERLSCGHRCQGYCGEFCPPCMRCQVEYAVFRSRGTVKRWRCPISGIPYHPKRLAQDYIFMLPCGCIFWCSFLDKEFMKVTSEVFKKCPNCRSIVADFRCFRYEHAIKISFYSMSNLNKIRRLESEGNLQLARNGRMDERIRIVKSRCILKFLSPLARYGIVNRHFPPRKEFNFVEVMERAEIVMEEIVELQKLFFFETGIDASEFLARYLKEISRTRVELSVFICQVVNCFMLSKEENDQKEESFTNNSNIDGPMIKLDRIVSRKRKKLEIETKIMKTLGYLKYLGEDYDKFYRFYHDGMGRRLLLNLSNVEDEKWLLSLFRKEFAHVFERKNWVVNNPKLEQAEKMIRDLSISKDLNLRFNRENRGGSTVTNGFEVKVLSKIYWPGFHFKVCPDVRNVFFRACRSKFEEFYGRVHENRNLEWFFNGFQTVRMIGRFARGVQQIDVNGVQATVLELFNEKSEWDWNGLKSEVGEEEDRKIVKFMKKISSEKKFRVLRSGKKVKVNSILHVVLDQSERNEEQNQNERRIVKKVVLNEDYNPRKRKVDFRSPSMSNHEFVKFSQAQLQDRMEQIKAAITRVLKKKKMMFEDEIYPHVCREVKLFRPQIRDIERGVNVLITMDILERKRKKLIYKT